MTTTFVPSAGHLAVQRVYLRVNEPMLFSARNEFGDLYFVSYADITDNGEMWMLTRVSEERLIEFERGQIDIRDMFLGAEAGSVTLVEYDDEQPEHPILRYLLPTDEALTQYLAAEGRKNPTPIQQAAQPAEIRDAAQPTQLYPHAKDVMVFRPQLDNRAYVADFIISVSSGFENQRRETNRSGIRGNTHSSWGNRRPKNNIRSKTDDVGSVKIDFGTFSQSGKKGTGHV